MGCMVAQTFLYKNPTLKIAGLIYEAPYFGMHESTGLHNPLRKLIFQAGAKIEGLNENLIINPGMKPGLVSSNKLFMRKSLNINGTCMPFASLAVFSSQLDGCADTMHQAKS